MVADSESNGSRATHYRRIAEAFVGSAVAGLRTVPMPELAAAVQALDAARRGGRRVYVMGNGGSASTADHMVCDLVKTAQRPPEPPLRAFALVDNNAALTAYANDVSYADVFACQLAANAEPDDTVVVISASGRSPNVLSALRVAKDKGLFSIGLLGCGGGPAASLVDLPLIVDSTAFGVIETAHLAIVHALTAALGASGPQTTLAQRGGVAKER